MKGRTVFEKITDINEKFLEEAAFVPAAGAGGIPPRRERGSSGFSRFMNSGWGVAAVCALVAIGTIVGIVAAGQAGDPTVKPPVPHGSTPIDPDFTMTSAETHVPPETDAIITIEDESEPVDPDFTVSSEEESTPADPDAPDTTEGDSEPIDPDFTVTMEEESVPVEVETFPISEPETTPPLITEDFEPELSFSIVQYLDLSWRGMQAGQSTTIRIGVTNVGEGFSYMGASGSFHIEYAALVPQGSTYEEGYAAVIYDHLDYTQVAVPTGTVGTYEATFYIPEDAPVGKYDLVVGFWSCEKVFTGVVTVMPDIDLPEEEVRASADAEVKRQTGLTDLSSYDVSIKRRENGEWNLEYRVYIQGYPTMDALYVNLATDGTVMDYRENGSIYIGEFDSFIPHVTKEMTDEAIAKLGDVDKSKLYWYIDWDEYLCIGYEIVWERGDCIEIETVGEPVCPRPE